jgi:hypothetical protein
MAARLDRIALAQQPLEVGAVDQELSHSCALGREQPLRDPQANRRRVETQLLGDLRDRQPGVVLVGLVGTHFAFAAARTIIANNVIVLADDKIAAAMPETSRTTIQHRPDAVDAGEPSPWLSRC